jgi:hypothetical protein
MAFSTKIREVMEKDFTSRGLKKGEATILAGLKQIDRFDDLSTKERLEMEKLENKLETEN